jgi:hypothetical protein
VVILGCGRSGTSIFGELFDHIAGYTYHSEPSFGELRHCDFTTPQAIKVPRPEEGAAVSSGLPFLFDDLLAVVPEPRKIFWQVRHPLDAICSLRVGIGKNWGHHPRPPDWRDWLDRPLLERCAHHWTYLNTVGYGQIRHMAGINRFEDMLGDPLACATKVCEEVGLDPVTHAQDLKSRAKRVQDTNNEDFDEAECSRNYSRADHVHKIERWRENLREADVAVLVPMVGEAAGALGYALP